MPLRTSPVLDEARRRGFLGSGAIGDHQAHALAFAEAYGPEPPARALDLGTGGGIPGLVLAEHWPSSSWVLLDTDRRRIGFLEVAVFELGWAGRVSAVHGRAEAYGRDPLFRASFDAVVARSFGPPAVTAECAAPFLRQGGLLVVSDPPTGGAERWSAAGLAALGLTLDATPARPGAHFSRLRQEALCPERFPRRPGVASRRPLF